MRLEQSFEVPVPVAQAWGVLLDIERIAPCMPGATLTGFDGDTFTGTVKVKLGPVSLAYKGTGRFTERDEAGRRVSLVASGQDSRGAGGAAARITAVLHNSGDGSATLVKVVADLDIAGRAAQFGRGMIADVSGKLIKQFADCLAETIGAAPAAAPVPAPAAPSAAPAPVNATPAPAPSPLKPVFTEPASPAATPEAAEAPEYHPLAMQEPPEPVAPIAPPPPPRLPEVPATPQPETAYAYTPEPAPVAEVVPPAPAQPAAQPSAAKPARPEAEPIDLLAVSGAKGMLRRAAPVLIIVGLALVGLIVWLAVR